MKFLYLIFLLSIFSIRLNAQCDSLVLISPTTFVFCEGDSVTLEAESLGGGTITWNEGENGIPFLLESSGYHTFTAASDLETDCPLEVELLVYAPPVMTFAADNLIGSVPFHVNFAALVSDEVEEYTWDFGDGETATVDESDISHTYLTSGTFDVTLTVTAASTGCEGSLTFVEYIDVYDGSGDDSSLPDNEVPFHLIYPDQTNTHLVIEFSASAAASIMISDLQGKLVYVQENVANSQVSIDTETWPKGIYNLSFFDINQKGKMYSTKITIQ